MFIEKQFLSSVRINHIGSTAIYSIWAKPIIDILIEIPKEQSLSDYKTLIIKNGYICMSLKEYNMSFNKGYINKGFDERVFHLHLRHIGDNDEFFLEIILSIIIKLQKEYEKLKLKLWKDQI